MLIIVTRDLFFDNCTLGKLTVVGRTFETIEDTVREVAGLSVNSWKIFGKTAIPKGSYEVILSFSNRFQKVLPELLNVPGFSKIRIHSGNTSTDTEGCILLGLQRGKEMVSNSRNAMEQFMSILIPVINAKKKITLVIK